MTSRKHRAPTGEIYAALQMLKQGFEQSLSAMNRLNQTPLKHSGLFDGSRLLLEEAAAWACYEVIDALQELELENWAMSGQAWQQWEKAHQPIEGETSRPKNKKRPMDRS